MKTRGIQSVTMTSKTNSFGASKPSAKIQTAIAERQKRLDIATESSVYINMVFELLSLIKNDEDSRYHSHISNIARQMQGILKYSNISEKAGLDSLFFDIAEFRCMSEIDGYDKAFADLKKMARKESKRLRIPLPTTGDEQEILNANSLPIMKKMVCNPEDAQGLFLDMVDVLNRFVKSGELSVFAAAGEVSCVLDRPQIYTDPKFENIVVLGYGLGDICGDFEKDWRDFVKATRELKKAEMSSGVLAEADVKLANIEKINRILKGYNGGR